MINQAIPIDKGVVNRNQHLENDSPWRAGDCLPEEIFAGIRRKALLEFCKWDPQVGDVSTLADFPLLLSADTWQALTEMSERLAMETLAAEQEILQRPELLQNIGLPKSIRRVLGETQALGASATAARTMRFDFHLTTDGWRISEVNSDVPGGFTEASSFTQLIAAHCEPASPTGDPATAWSKAIVEAAGSGGNVGLLTAPGFMEDHQIMAYLSRKLTVLGCRTHMANPLQLTWRDGFASLNSNWCRAPLDAIVRFYQGEWIANLPAGSGWQNFFRGSKTPLANPGSAIIPESKRFPLVWDQLQTCLPNWRKLLPETRDPREVPWQTDDGWLVKSAFCNTGDTVSIRAAMDRKKWEAVTREVRRHPEDWVAQRRFETVTVATPHGPMHPCVGIYVINGRTAGAYGRISASSVIDFAAIDIAILVENRETANLEFGVKSHG